MICIQKYVLFNAKNLSPTLHLCQKKLLANNIFNDMISHIMKCELCIVFSDLKYSLEMSSRPYCYFIT